MQWFAQIWNTTELDKSETAVKNAQTYRYEVAAALLTGTQNNLEVAEIAIKVLDWTDAEPFIAFLYIAYIEKLCQSTESISEQLGRILDELLKRI